MKKEKIILDTNIWVSYFFNAKLHDLAKIILNNDLKVQTSTSLINELQGVLSRKKISKRLNLPLEIYMDFHREYTTQVSITEVFSGCPDPKDDYLFDLALQSETKILVTGDKKLLGFKTENISVISLTGFLERYKK